MERAQLIRDSKLTFVTTNFILSLGPSSNPCPRMLGRPESFQNEAPRGIDKDWPWLLQPETIIKEQVCGWRITQDISSENRLGLTIICSAYLYIEFIESTGRFSLGKFPSRTNLGWHSVSANHSRPISWRVTPNGSRACIRASVPRLPPKRQYQIPFSRGAVLVEDPLGLSCGATWRIASLCLSTSIS